MPYASEFIHLELEEEEEEQAQEDEQQDEPQEDQAQGEEGNTDTSSDTEAEDTTEYIPKQSHDVIRNKYKEAKEEREQLKKQLEELQKQNQGEDQGQKLQETEQKAQEYRQKYENTLKETKLQQLASKYEAKDTDTVKKLVDLSEVEIDEDGTVNTTDLDEQLRSLQQEKPFLFGEEKAKNIGNSSGNAPEGGTKETPWIKESELQANPEWMNNNLDTVHKAAKEGKIIRDL